MHPSFAALGDLLVGVVDEVLPDLPAPQRRALEAALPLDEGDGAAADARAVAVAFLACPRLLAEDGPIVLLPMGIQLDCCHAQPVIVPPERVNRSAPARSLPGARVAPAPPSTA